jgi:hypothetical protein
MIGEGFCDISSRGVGHVARPAIKKPDFWCKEWYIEQKEKGLHDWEIAEYELGIAYQTLSKWKKEFNLPKWKFNPYAGARHYKK